MNEEMREYLRDSLALMDPELNRPDGYDEIYVLTTEDFRNLKIDMTKPDLGIPLLAQGQLMSRLQANATDHYRAVSQMMAATVRKPDDVIADSAVSIIVRGKDGEPPYKVGIIFSESLGRGYWNKLAPRGLSPETKDDLNVDGEYDQDDIKKFIVTPHEVGHLLAALDNGRFGIDTSKSMQQIAEEKRTRGVIGVREGEVEGDVYAQKVFDRAKDQGLVENKFALDRHLYFRTLVGVDEAIVRPGSKHTHITSPFMPGEEFHGVQMREFDLGTAMLASRVDVSVAQTLGDHVVSYNQGRIGTPSSFWDVRIQSCFKNASDLSYSAWKSDNDLIQGLGRTLGLKNMENLPPRLSFSDEFRSCVLNNFNARHKVLSEQHDSVQPGSAEERILHMYEMAAIELPERETKDPAQVTADSVRRSFHVPELGLRR
jgi:hypothetical protein